jgi:hypothetical protein
MAFTLRVTFSGMCLFAPEVGSATRPDRMHVLMPRATSHGHEDHVPIVEFDIAHLTPGTQNTDIFAQWLLRSRGLKIEGAGASLSVCHDVVSLYPVVGRRVPEELFEGNPGGVLTSRVTLGAGRMSAVAKGACWEWNPDEPRRLAHQAQWSISNMPGDAYPIQLQGLTGGGGVGPVVQLHPIGEDELRVIQLYVSHLPSADMGPEPRDIPEPHHDSPAPHFDRYFDLYGPQTPIRLPRYRSDSQCPEPDPTDCPILVGKGESAFNCMLATG